MVEAINEDEESGVPVLGSKDNTEILPDINYEITKLMKNTDYYHVWEKVSKQEIGWYSDQPPPPLLITPPLHKLKVQNTGP